MSKLLDRFKGAQRSRDASGRLYDALRKARADRDAARKASATTGEAAAPPGETASEPAGTLPNAPAIDAVQLVASELPIKPASEAASEPPMESASEAASVQPIEPPGEAASDATIEPTSEAASATPIEPAAETPPEASIEPANEAASERPMEGASEAASEPKTEAAREPALASFPPARMATRGDARSRVAIALLIVAAALCAAVAWRGSVESRAPSVLKIDPALDLKRVPPDRSVQPPPKK
jgi:hypothetical protein